MTLGRKVLRTPRFGKKKDRIFVKKHGHFVKKVCFLSRKVQCFCQKKSDIFCYKSPSFCQEKPNVFVKKVRFSVKKVWFFKPKIIRHKKSGFFFGSFFESPSDRVSCLEVHTNVSKDSRAKKTVCCAEDDQKYDFWSQILQPFFILCFTHFWSFINKPKMAFETNPVGLGC